jgi:hypothetical protein
MIAFILRGEKNEISCSKGADLRDNDFNIGGLVIRDGVGRNGWQNDFDVESRFNSERRSK